MLVSVSSCTSLSLCLPSILPSAASAYFLLVVVWNVFDRHLSGGHGVFYFIYLFVAPFATQNDGMVSPHTVPPPPLCYDITTITSADSRLIVGYLD